jgi:hypothetical protein
MKLLITDLSGRRFGRLVVIENWGIVDGKATLSLSLRLRKGNVRKEERLRRDKTRSCDCRGKPAFATPAEASLAYRKFYHHSEVVNPSLPFDGNGG